jgi:pimeloyl-ACP methyl ester carboxylesterase
MKKLVSVVLITIASLLSFGQSPAFTVKKTGKGTPLLFLPGFATPGSVWNETIKSLASENESHVFSYAGFNGVPAIDTPWYSTIKTALLHYISKEKLSNLVIIGHSIGGSLAIDIAAAIPEKVSKLILVDAIPCIREIMMPGVAASQIQYNAPYNNQLLNMPSEIFRNTAVMMAGYMTSDKAKIDSITNWLTEADRKTYVYGYTDLLRLDLRDELAKIKCKTLILGASLPDGVVAEANFEKQYQHLPEKLIVMAPPSKHFIMFDQPAWFYEQVNAFLKK